jgi:hypothetical protein
MKGSIPRGEFEAEMEKGPEEVNPKKFAPRADLGGREGGGGKREGADGQRRRVVWSLPQNFESLSIIFFFYFPFPKQLLNFSPMANLFFICKSNSMTFHQTLARVELFFKNYFKVQMFLSKFQKPMHLRN